MLVCHCALAVVERAGRQALPGVCRIGRGARAVLQAAHQAATVDGVALVLDAVLAHGAAAAAVGSGVQHHLHGAEPLVQAHRGPGDEAGHRVGPLGWVVHQAGLKPPSVLLVPLPV